MFPIVLSTFTLKEEYKLQFCLKRSAQVSPGPAKEAWIQSWLTSCEIWSEVALEQVFSEWSSELVVR
jgi:hypothetical protein